MREYLETVKLMGLSVILAVGLVSTLILAVQASIVINDFYMGVCGYVSSN